MIHGTMMSLRRNNKKSIEDEGLFSVSYVVQRRRRVAWVYYFIGVLLVYLLVSVEWTDGKLELKYNCCRVG